MVAIGVLEESWVGRRKILFRAAAGFRVARSAERQNKMGFFPRSAKSSARAFGR
jgi:hypothetical protein